jgi:conjugal transfer pilus assembly protein TraD
VSGERAIPLARRLSGERALPVQEGIVLLSLERLLRHVLVCGATGAGKTETLLRIAWAVAKTSDTPVFFLDGKGDTQTAERFCGLMADASRLTRVFPNEPFDAWRGAAHEVHGRLMEIIDYASDGPATWYRDLAKNTLRLVCEHPDGPPRDTATLLARLELAQLEQAHPRSSAVAALTREQVRQVRLRYEAFFGQSRGSLDGDWAWEDTQAAYLLLDTLALKEETAGLSRLLLEDFAHYFTHRKPRRQFCLLIVDELSALAGNAGIARQVEQARGFNAGLILAPQVTAGLGDAAEAERITGSVETIVCHRVNTPESIIALAGTRKVPEHLTRFAGGRATGEGSIRIRDQSKIDANRVRALPPGAVFIISKNRAMGAQILRAPRLAAALPPIAPPPSAADRADPAGQPVEPSSAATVNSLRF